MPTTATIRVRDVRKTFTLEDGEEVLSVEALPLPAPPGPMRTSGWEPPPERRFRVVTLTCEQVRTPDEQAGSDTVPAA